MSAFPPQLSVVISKNSQVVAVPRTILLSFEPKSFSRVLPEFALGAALEISEEPTAGNLLAALRALFDILVEGCSHETSALTIVVRPGEITKDSASQSAGWWFLETKLAKSYGSEAE